MEYLEKSSCLPTESRNRSNDRLLPAPAPHLGQVEVDDSKATSNYANFCRLSGTPEELLIDFGLSLAQPTSLTVQPIAVSQRIIAGWYTAKRLLHVLQLTVERHEAAFGNLETDVRKRIGRA